VGVCLIRGRWVGMELNTISPGLKPFALHSCRNRSKVPCFILASPKALMGREFLNLSSVNQRHAVSKSRAWSDCPMEGGVGVEDDTLVQTSRLESVVVKFGISPARDTSSLDEEPPLSPQEIEQRFRRLFGREMMPKERSAFLLGPREPNASRWRSVMLKNTAENEWRRGQFANTEDQESRIRRRAYELYEQRGKGEGRALNDWLRAEREIKTSNQELRAAS